MTSRARGRLFSRIGVTVAGLIAVAVAVPSALNVDSKRRWLRESLETRAIATAETAALGAASLLAAGDVQGLQAVVTSMVRTDDRIESVAITDPAGKAIAHSDALRLGETHLDLSPPPTRLAVSETPRDDGTSTIEVTAPLAVSGAPFGSVRATFRMASLASAVHEELDRVMVSAGAVFALGVLASAWLARSMTKPIRQLAKVAGQVSAGDLTTRTGLRAKDEIGAFAEAFDRMIFDLARAQAGFRAHSASLEKRVLERTREFERTTQELRGKEALLRSMAETSRLGFLVVDDRTSEVLYVNRRYCALFGIEQLETALQRNELRYTDVLPRCAALVANGADFVETCRRLHRESVRDVLEDEILLRDGRTVRRFSAQIRDEHGAYFGRLYLFEDVTARRKAEAELAAARDSAVQVSRMKSEFLANMSHEIRTPLNGVLGLTEIVLETDLSPEQREYIEHVHASGSALLSLLNDILDLSKVEAGKLELESVAFALRHVVESAMQTLASRAIGKGLRFERIVEVDVPNRLLGDPTRLTQVLLNLLSNAIKFTSEGEVVLHASLMQSRPGGVVVHFAVRDTGTGIPSDKLNVIFEPFTQADGSTTRKYGGTGLGLTIARKIAEQMGGHLWAESEVGKGSTFRFTASFGLADAPASESAAPDVSARTPPPAPDAESADATGAPVVAARVLVAEDNVVNQKVVARMLQKRGWEVELVSDGRTAVERALAGSFDVVLMDVQMPELDGFAATAEIRRREQGARTRVPIVALTAHAMKGDRERCIAGGMDDYLTKPIQSKELYALVERILAKPPSAGAPRGRVAQGLAGLARASRERHGRPKPRRSG
ncbi:MAG TPA: ATP-binding protein [Planctomycetota bacterium]|nr:ATP-binding protein [Planctomycetota bacterium]